MHRAQLEGPSSGKPSTLPRPIQGTTDHFLLWAKFWRGSNLSTALPTATNTSYVVRVLSQTRLCSWFPQAGLVPGSIISPWTHTQPPHGLPVLGPETRLTSATQTRSCPALLIRCPQPPPHTDTRTTLPLPGLSPHSHLHPSTLCPPSSHTFPQLSDPGVHLNPHFPICTCTSCVLQWELPVPSGLVLLDKSCSRPGTQLQDHCLQEACPVSPGKPGCPEPWEVSGGVSRDRTRASWCSE